LSSDLEIIDDLNSTVKYAAKSRQVGVYFEGTNILVKVTGSGRNDSEAVLFSAHFDSVPVAPGATDNGIGVVGTLQLLE
jgi:Zn-dependent M28 family amino/carboxypeptidase